MAEYQGEFDINLSATAFASYGPAEWALYFIGSYGGTDGAHHKAWVLDQAARCLLGTPVVVREARWASGETELRVITGEPSSAYRAWVVAQRAGEDGPDTYEYDEGVAP